MPEKLPNGWIKTTLGEIAAPSRERALPTDFPALPYVGLENIESHSMRVLEHGYARSVRSSSVRFSKGDVLYGKMRPYLNKVWVAEFDGLCSAEFLVFPTRKGLDSRFLATRLNAEDFVTLANGRVSGERPRVDFEKLSGFSILLPPALEQERIMTKLGAAFAGVDRAETAARRAQERLRRYRVAVLRAACEGTLVPTEADLRRAGKVPGFESGDDILQRILKKRRQSSARDGKYKELAPPDTSNLQGLPEGWTYASVEQLGIVGEQAVLTGPFGTSLGRQDFVESGVPVLTISCLRDTGIDLDNADFVSEEKALELSRYRLKPGDLLFSRMASIGRAGIVDETLNNALFNYHIMRLRLQPEALLAKFYLTYVRGASQVEDYLREANHGATRSGITTAQLLNMPVVLPPLAEQVRIVAEVERRLAAAEHFGVILETSLTRSSALRESLLRDAFAGGLVDQDPHDEPAALLIERIRAALEIESKKPRGRHMSKSNANKRASGRHGLLLILKENGGSMTPEDLFHASGHSEDSVDEFFAELRELTTIPAKIIEERKSKITLLKAVV